MADKKVLELAKRFLRYSFNDISDKYEGLTKEEKKLCTETEFNELVKWMLEGVDETPSKACLHSSGECHNCMSPPTAKKES